MQGGLNSYRENCTMPRNFHTRKLGEITVLYAAIRTSNIEAI